jgi:anti-sigma factor RsiW
MSDFKDIWNEGEGGAKLTDEQLMAYLEGRLPEDERHAVEAILSSEGMESDALEGLQSLDPSEAKGMKHYLNTELQKSLGKNRRKRRGLESQQWNVTSVVILLLLILICFAVFWLMRHKH